MKYKIIYLFFLVSAFLYGSFHILGPLSLRHIASILMFAACILESKRFYTDKYWMGYSVFVVFWLLSSIATGFVLEFLNDLIGFVFVAYVGCWATVILKKKYDSLHLLVYTLVFIGVFDTVITVCQSLYITVFDSLLARLNLGFVSDDFLSKQDRGVDMMFVSIPGLFGTPVYNGHFLLIAFLSSFALQRYQFKPVGLVLSIVLFVGLFFCQQRGPFYLGVLLLVFILFKTYYAGRSTPKKVLFVLAILVMAVLILPPYLQNLSLLESRMSFGFEDDSRTVIYGNTFNWILDHPFGGIYKLRLIKDPHNFFLNAFVFGGWLGGLVIVYVLLMQLNLIAKVCCKSLNKYNYLTFIFAVAYLGVTGNSMVHNVSIITGDVVSWMVWTAFLVNHQSDNQRANGWKMVL